MARTFNSKQVAAHRHEVARLRATRPLPGFLAPATPVRAARLVNIDGDKAEFHHEGIAYECKRFIGGWRITDSFTTL